MSDKAACYWCDEPIKGTSVSVTVRREAVTATDYGAPSVTESRVTAAIEVCSEWCALRWMQRRESRARAVGARAAEG